MQIFAPLVFLNLLKIAVLDKTGTVVVKYEYDAWGEHSSYMYNDPTGVGSINPFRYRSYFYNEDSGYYFLGSRIYDPLIGRFLSPDSVEYADPTKVDGLNLYAYCYNNPVMYSDPTGHDPEWWEWLLLGIACVIVVAAAVVATVATGGVALVAAGIAIGGAVGGLASTVGQGLTNGWDNISVGGVAAGMFTGMVLGGIGGGIGAGASAAGGVGAAALVGGGTYIVGSAVLGAGAGIGANVLFSKHNPGMSNKPPVSWTTNEEGIGAYNLFGGNSNKAAEYLLNNKYGAGKWSRGAGTEFNAIKKWLDRIIRFMH